MSTLASQRCFNHVHREAAARCLHCGRYFCRECVTEHEDRIICAACLKSLAPAPLLRRRGVAGVLRVMQCGVSLVALWLFFYLLGDQLAKLPTAFHEGTLWQATWWNAG